MTKDAANIVPFGKYKGQPVEALAQDRQYCEWLAAQDWFRERYAGIYTLIINNFGEASETPEHNALQVLFLDDKFCKRFMRHLNPGIDEQARQRLQKTRQELMLHLKNETSQLKDKIASEEDRCHDRWARRQSELYTRLYANAEAEIESTTKYEREDLEKKSALLLAVSAEIGAIEFRFSKKFEERGVDVVLGGHLFSVRHEKLEVCVGSRGYFNHTRDFTFGQFFYQIEIKPSVGDDYPAVLRQMKANGSDVLLVGSYSGTGATCEQFVQTFATAKIRVVFAEELQK